MPAAMPKFQVTATQGTVTSTAIEGSTVTEIENQLLFDEGITAKGHSINRV